MDNTTSQEEIVIKGITYDDTTELLDLQIHEMNLVYALQVLFLECNYSAFDEMTNELLATRLKIYESQKALRSARPIIKYETPVFSAS